MFLVSFFCFLAFGVIRGDAAGVAGGTSISPEQLNELRGRMGLDRGLVPRYIDWLFNFLSGNPGNSLRYRGEVISTMITGRFPVSFSLAVMSFLLILIIAVPFSLFTVRREADTADRFVNFLTAAGISAPGFFLGLLFIFIFGYIFNLFVPGQFISYKESFSGFLGCLFFPALAIAVPNAAVMVKFLRGSLFQELKSEYVRTARSKGAGSLYILSRHVLKNAVIPAITVFGMIIAEVLSGSIIIEQVFSIPGTGRLLITAIASRDYPLIQALMVYIAFIVVAANTIADIVIMIIDPRIRMAKRDIQ
jgi:ABC-type dipeptide/oligopeptide/nickel transport system permease component